MYNVKAVYEPNTLFAAIDYNNRAHILKRNKGLAKVHRDNYVLCRIIKNSPLAEKIIIIADESSSYANNPRLAPMCN